MGRAVGLLGAVARELGLERLGVLDRGLVDKEKKRELSCDAYTVYAAAFKEVVRGLVGRAGFDNIHLTCSFLTLLYLDILVVLL